MSEWTLPRPIRLFAPAKVNLGLEVLGKRADGYHEVVTLMETISIFDVIDLAPAPSLHIESGAQINGEDDLIRRALEAIKQRTGTKLCLSATAMKRIPIAAGLGGGSSDAGTIIAALGRLMKLDLDLLHEIAATLGSDVPFFLQGGVTLATGSGINIQPVTTRGRRWYVIAVPNLHLEGKTASLYRSLEPDDFTDGARTRKQRERLEQNQPLDTSLLQNAFQRPLLEYPEFREAVDHFRSAGAECVLASGAGPAIFTITETFDEARQIKGRLSRSTPIQTFLTTSVSGSLNDVRVHGHTVSGGHYR